MGIFFISIPFLPSSVKSCTSKKQKGHLMVSLILPIDTRLEIVVLVILVIVLVVLVVILVIVLIIVLAVFAVLIVVRIVVLIIVGHNYSLL